MEVDSREERKNNSYEEGAFYQNIGGKFIPIVPSHNNSRSKSALPFQSDNLFQKYPNISVLKHLISIQAIQQYPRLALLVFDALLPFIEIFDNAFISFTDLCQEHNLIIKDFATTGENAEKFTNEISNLMKKIKLCEGASQGREVVLNFFIGSYQRNLSRRMTEKQLQPKDLMQGTGMSVQDYINHLVRQRSLLNKEELIFIIDFLINLCKHCQIFDNLSVSLGTHLLPDLFEKT